MKKRSAICFLIAMFMIVCLCGCLKKDMPYWYPKGDTSDFTDFHGTDLPLVVDDADVLTDDQENELNIRMKQVVGDLNIGYVLFTDDDNHGLSPEEYSSDFLHFRGYGVGEGYGAVVFYISFEPDNRCWRTTSINSYESIFNSAVTYQIDELVDADIRAGNYYEAFLKHIGFVEQIMGGDNNTASLPGNSGTVTDNSSDSSDNTYSSYPSYSSSSDSSSVSVPFERILICIAVGIVVGLIIGGMRLSSLKKAMRVVAPVDAREYLNKGSFVLRDKKTYYLYSTVTKTAKQKSSGSGGGSSFSSGSSSGGSYSSGGRSF